MPAPLPKLEGRFEGIVDDHARGWLYSQDAPRTRLEVELVSDGQVIARGIANSFRQGLLDAGIGDGKHAFSIPLPASLRDGKTHQLAIREAYTGQALAGGAHAFEAAPAEPAQATDVETAADQAAQQGGSAGAESAPSTAPGAAREPADRAPADEAGARARHDQLAMPSGPSSSTSQRPSPPRIEGSLDRVEQGRASGWVFSPDAPGSRLEVELLCEGQVVGRGLADRFRDDLRGAGVGDGRHGFDLALRLPRAEGAPLEVSAREAFTRQVLPGGPRVSPAPQPLTLTASPAPSTIQGHFDDIVHGCAEGWVFLTAEPQRRAEVEILCEGRVVARGLADQLRPDLREAGITDGHCSFSLPIDPFLFDGRSHELSARERSSGETLDGSPKRLDASVSAALRAQTPSHPQLAESHRPVRGSMPIERPSEPSSQPPEVEKIVPDSSRIQGRLEGVRDGRLEGWALDPVDPARRLEIEILCDGQLQGRSAADLYRPDLAEAGVGDGRHAFSWPLSASLLAGGAHALVARERGTGEALEGSPLALPSARVSAGPREASEPTALREPVHDAPAAAALAPEDTRTHPDGWADRLADEALASADAEAAVPHAPMLSAGDSSIAQPAAQPEPVPELQGCFEAIVNGQATGWVLDPLRPEDRIEVELLCDGEVIARAHADLEREDLTEVSLGDGRHGFRLPLGASLFDGRPHALSVRELRGQRLLPGSPHSLHSQQPPARVRPADVQGAFEAVSDRRASGYAWDMTRPDHRLEIEILCDGEPVARALANGFRRDLYESGIGDGRHGFSAPISYELFDGSPHWLTAREAHTGKALTQGPHLFEQPSLHWPFDLMSRAETLQGLERLLSDPRYASRGLDPDACRRQLLDASLCQEMRQTERARAGYQRALGLLGENPLCYCKLAETWLLDGEPDSALDEYRRAAALPGAAHWAHLGIGNALKQREQFVEAEDAYQAALRLAPRDARVLARLDEIRAHAVPLRVDRLLADGRLDEGIRLLKGRLIEEPENPMIIDKLARLLARQEGETERSGGLDDADEIAAFDSSLRVLELLLAEGGDRRRQTPTEVSS